MMRRTASGADIVYEAESMAESEALRVILKHERIDYSVGIGVGHVSCFFVNKVNDIRLQKALVQWQRAVRGLANAIEA